MVQMEGMKKDPVGRLGVHVYQQFPLPHGNEVICRLPAGVFVFLQIDGRSGDQQLPAAARIFYRCRAIVSTSAEKNNDFGEILSGLFCLVPGGWT